jgi:heat shock protein HslJ
VIAAVATVAVLVTAAVILASLRASNGRPPAALRSDLERTSWKITAVTSPDGKSVAIPENTSATVSFLDARHATGTDSINTWRAIYMVHGSDVTFTQAMSTLVGAAPGHPVTDALFGATGALLNDRPVRTQRSESRLSMTVGGYSLTLSEMTFSTDRLS